MNAQAPMPQDPQVIVSNGFGRFILRLAAAEAGRRGALAAYITAAYPTERLARMMRGTGLDRFLSCPRSSLFVSRPLSRRCMITRRSPLALPNSSNPGALSRLGGTISTSQARAHRSRWISCFAVSSRQDDDAPADLLSRGVMSKSTRLIEWLPRLSEARVLCVGDVMLDRFVYGHVERISPEAPIPILTISRQATTVGGAGNVARNLSALGTKVNLFGAIGADSVGAEAVDVLANDSAVTLSLTTDPSRPTTVKTRFIAGVQQLLRTDDEDSSPLADTLLSGLSKNLEAAMESGDYGALILSDYGKGVLSGAVIAQAISAARAAGLPVIVDPKGTDYTRYRGASLLTPNRRELAEAARHPVDSDDEAEAAARILLETCGVEAVIATRGPRGMSVVTADGCVHLPALAREVFDVSGAGDTVVATVAAGLAAGLALTDAAQLANVAAGIVVAKVGTAVVCADELGDALGRAPGRGAKFLGRDDVVDRVAQWRARGLSVGFTNGCFDLVHPGHISLIEQASAACDRLVVALNNDASVARLKGPERPVQPEAARGRVIASLAGVDAVVLFAEDTPRELIEIIRPDVLVKGADYAAEEVVGGDFVTAYGGQIVLAELVDGFSTTDTISRISS